jgi:hypothetical protein
LWQSRITVDTSYAFLLPAFMLMGLGLGLVMSPMSTAAMNAVDRTKAGVASGTLSMSRMVGGTFGVAVLGALVAAVGRHDLAQSLPFLPHATRERLVDGLGSSGVAQDAPRRSRERRAVGVRGRARHGADAGRGVAALAAVLAWLLIDPTRPAAPAEEPTVEALEPQPVTA